jgi:hypothetical protein
MCGTLAALLLHPELLQPPLTTEQGDIFNFLIGQSKEYKLDIGQRLL